MPQVPEEIKQRLVNVTTRFLVKHKDVTFEEVTELIQDISTILFDYMEVPLEKD